jgi:GNAT superfamily N-acetyltransferase
MLWRNLAATTLVVIYSLSAHAAGSCKKIFASPNSNKSITSRRSPDLAVDELRETIEKNGVALKDLRLAVQEGEGAVVELFYRRQIIGNGQLQYFENTNHFGRIYIDIIHVDDAYRGKGLGSLMYLALAKQAHLQGVILESSHDLTSDSTSIWNRFAKAGLATKVDNQFFEMDERIFTSQQFQAKLDDLLSALRLRPSEVIAGTELQMLK